MHVCLTKKVAIPNGGKLHTVSWNPEHSWLVAGGEGGLLKVLKRDSAAATDGARGVAAPTNLSANQTLEAHKNTVTVSAWNSRYRKLTTSDAAGSIVVWVLHKGAWYEEMVNNRNKSAVADLRWRGSGDEICIGYEDGAVILGHVNGNRVWARDLAAPLSKLEWSPDGSRVLFGMASGVVQVYSHQGALLGPLPLPALTVGTDAEAAGSDPCTPPVPTRTVAAEWYDGAEGYAAPRVPCLALGWENGRLQLMRGLEDRAPVLIDTGLQLKRARWNSNGTMLAAAGLRVPAPGAAGKPASEVQFYTPYGAYVTGLKIPGGTLNDLTWEGGGLRMAMAVDAFLYFATVRPQYLWAALGDTIVYALVRPDRVEHYVIFWNTKTNERVVKHVRGLVAVRGAGDKAVLVTMVDEPEVEAEAAGSSDGAGPASPGPGGKAAAGGFGARGAAASPGGASAAPSSPSKGSAGGAGASGWASTPAAAPTGTPLASQYALHLCDEIGNLLVTRYTTVRPDTVQMSQDYVAVASSDTLYLWKHVADTSAEAGGVAKRSASDPVERVFHLDERAGAVAAAATTSVGGGGLLGLGLGLGGGRKGSHMVRAPVLAAAGGGAAAASAAAAAAPTADAPGDGAFDGICALALSSKTLLLGRESGAVLRYALPSFTHVATYSLRCRPAELALNCDDTRFAILDANHTCTIFDTAARGLDGAGNVTVGDHLSFERRDVWAVKWAEDYPDLWVAMEKTRLYVFRDTDPEEPLLSSGYLARFRDLTVTTVLLDEVMTVPDAPSSKEHITAFECRSLRDTRILLARNGLKDTLSFVADNAHPRLWRLLAETALERLDFPIAEKAFVACGDYHGIQFVKRLRVLQDRNKQRAEVAVYFKRFADAEKLYADIDRPDLVLDLHARLGNWKTVLTLLEEAKAAGNMATLGSAGSEAMLALAHTRVGDALADAQKWRQAIPHYEAARCLEPLVEAYYAAEDFDALARLVDELAATAAASAGGEEGAAASESKDGSSSSSSSGGAVVSGPHAPLLFNIARKLQSVGMVDAAVKAFLAVGESRAAVDACVEANRWDTAVSLAERYRLPAITTLLSQYSQRLLDEGDVVSAIELQRRAHNAAEAARLLTRAGLEAVGGKADPLTAKRTLVAAALELQAGAVAAAAQHTSAAGSGGGDALDAAVMSPRRGGGGGGAADAALSPAAVAAAWHRAEGVHFWLLAHRQLYGGDIAAALATAARVALYDDVVPPQAAHSLLAVAAYYNRAFGTASKAFVRLEALESAPLAEREAYADLALAIFTAVPPRDAEAAGGSTAAAPTRPCPTAGCGVALPLHAPNCITCGTTFPVCVATGAPLHGSEGATFTCGTCAHSSLAAAVKGRASCPLCHAAMPASAQAGTKLRR